MTIPQAIAPAIFGTCMAGFVSYLYGQDIRFIYGQLFGIIFGAIVIKLRCEHKPKESEREK